MVEAVNAIELKNITKRFGEKVIANDSVNLTVRKGEILSLLGENGSGKTTLMNMLSGIYFPDEGQIFVNGKEVMISSPKDAFDLGIGMIHQHFKLIEVLTAAENIILGLPGKMTLNMDEVIKDIQALVDKYGFELDCRKKIYHTFRTSGYNTCYIFRRSKTVCHRFQCPCKNKNQDCRNHRLKSIRETCHTLIEFQHTSYQIQHDCDHKSKETSVHQSLGSITS